MSVLVVKKEKKKTRKKTRKKREKLNIEKKTHINKIFNTVPKISAAVYGSEERNDKYIRKNTKIRFMKTALRSVLPAMARKK